MDRHVDVVYITSDLMLKRNPDMTFGQVHLKAISDGWNFDLKKDKYYKTIDVIEVKHKI